MPVVMRLLANLVPERCVVVDYFSFPGTMHPERTVIGLPASRRVDRQNTYFQSEMIM
jgi:hypothetical protein